MSEETWTTEDEAVYRPLRCKLLRIQAKQRRDKTRVRKFSPRGLIVRNKQAKEQKDSTNSLEKSELEK